MMRSGLDRRRLSDAFFKYNAASWLAENGDLDVDVSLLFKSDVSKTGEGEHPLYRFLDAQMPRFLEYLQRWMSHSCDHPRCSRSWVIDGITLRRPTCGCYREVGCVLECPELVLPIQIGCPESPAHKQSVCRRHLRSVARRDAGTIPTSVSPLEAFIAGPEAGVHARTRAQTVPTSRVSAVDAEDNANVDADNEYGVGAILDSRAVKAKRKPKRKQKKKKKAVDEWCKEYLVKWHGFDDTYNTWEKRDCFEEELIQQYERHVLTTGRTIMYEMDVPPGTRFFEIDDLEAKEIAEMSCVTEKDSLLQGKAVTKLGRRHFRTWGAVEAVWNCGIIFGYQELFYAESKSQIFYFLLVLIRYACKCGFPIPPVAAYDDACHLVAFLRNRRGMSEYSAVLCAIDWCIDRFHLDNHKDPKCKRLYNPDTRPELDEVSTQACEETFSWLGRYKSAERHMSRCTHEFFNLRVSHLHNLLQMKRNTRRFKGTAVNIKPRRRYNRDLRGSFDPMKVVTAYRDPFLKQFVIAADLELVREWVQSSCPDEMAAIVARWRSVSL